MRYSEFAERFGDLEQEAFLTRFGHPFLLENVELQSDDHDRRVFLVRGSKGNALLIGRGPRCHIPIRDALVSTKHAELLPPDVAGAGDWHIVDLNSTNKTFLSGRELEPDFPAPVTDRVALALGPSTHFTFLHPLSFFALLKEHLSHTPEPRESAATTDLLGTIPYGQLTSAPKASKEIVDPTRAKGDELLVFCEPLDPIPLDVGRALIVGRSANTADLVLNHKHVSRRHTEIQRLPHGVFVRDMGSSNGTLLEGKQLPDDWTPLPVGGVLVIGPYRIYVAGPQSSGTAMNLGGTLVMGRKRGTEGIEGSLVDMSLEMILQEIETEQHTGALELSGATITGRLTFLNGHPRDASTDDGLSGGEAVLRLLKETRGTYLLRPTTEIGEAQIDRTFSELLLERFLSEA